MPAAIATGDAAMPIASAQNPFACSMFSSSPWIAEDDPVHVQAYAHGQVGRIYDNSDLSSGAVRSGGARPPRQVGPGWPGRRTADGPGPQLVEQRADGRVSPGSGRRRVLR